MGLLGVRNRITDAEKTNNRVLGSVNLIAVSKLQPIDRIEKVLNIGHRTFGENRVQEAYQKWPKWKVKFDNVSLHLLGPLQTNKSKDAIKLFDVIHSLDRQRLVKVLANEIQKIGKSPKLFVQVNTGEEKQKTGVIPSEADSFIRMCIDEYELEVVGLMCIPPIDEEPALHFALLKKIAERNGLKRLSMGMSSDFEVAIALGATDIRIGAAIFGERV